MNTTNNQVSVDKIRKDVEQHADAHFKLLQEALKASFKPLSEFQDWIHKRMEQAGLEVEDFFVEKEELKDQLAKQKTLREDPDSLQRAKNVVGKLKGKQPRHGLLLYTHADKKPETFDWAKTNNDMVEKQGRLYGPGIADDVCGITAMISAAETYQRLGLSPKGDVLLASILGKQMGIFGTYGLMKRYGPLDAAIYVHPAESGDGLGELKIASNGAVEFIIQVDGKEPNTTEPLQGIFSQSAVSAVDKCIYLYLGLRNWADEMRKNFHHARLEKLCNQSFSLTAARFTGAADEIYKIPMQCELAGYVSFSPNEKFEEIKSSFEEAFNHLVAADPWLAKGNVKLEWGDLMGESCQADENSEFIKMATHSIEEVTGKTPKYHYGHTTSDIRYPMLYWDAQAFGVGPLAGDIAKETEWVDQKEYIDSIIVVTEMMKNAA